MSKIRYCLIIIFTILFHTYSKSQGCSDAGFCTLKNFKPELYDTLSEMKKNQVSVGISGGKADYSITIINYFLEYTRALNRKLNINTKVTWMSQSGNDITSSDFSDIYFTFNYSILKSTKITVGTKLPLNDANKKNSNGLSLPMDYQSSLGTIDLIVGIAHESEHFQYVLALQKPLTQNKNEFMPGRQEANSILRTFQSTNKYKRSGDILLRLSYPFKINNKNTIIPSLLPIYHLKDDQFLTNDNYYADITGSQGLTLNGNVYFDYSYSPKSVFSLNLGVPLLTRKARPDGLTRKFVFTFNYTFSF